MTIEVSWPSTTPSPYEVTVETANDDLFTDSGDDDEYARFEQLTRQLLTVPKSEVDEARRNDLATG